ncbi:MAG TPA: hybrid sensor histidine kinase/response regulator [Rhodobacteraceae bacterium]|nr:hybrid sensor histidine kinase/response regulator [Paracoccaceae bacterium]
MVLFSGVSASLLALVIKAPEAALAMRALAMTLLALAAGLALLSAFSKTRRAKAETFLRDMIEEEPSVAFLCNEDGAVRFSNRLARRSLDPGADTLGEALGTLLAQPGPLIFRLQSRALTVGVAEEEVMTSAGRVRLMVRFMFSGVLLWRVFAPDELLASRRLAALTIGRNGTILHMNDAARDLVGKRARTVAEVFPSGLVHSGQINTLLSVEGQKQVFAADVTCGKGRREILIVPSNSNSDALLALDRLPVATLQIRADLTIQAINFAAQELLGETAKTGMDLTDLMEGPGRSMRDWLAEAMDGRGSSRPEFLRLKRSDREVFVQVSLRSYDVSPGAKGILAVLSDATDLKSLEAQFVQSQKMQAIGQLAGGIAHDFNNLLTAISGHCDLLLLRHDPGDGDYADLMQIRQNANRAAALVGQLLAFSRKQTLEPQSLDLRDILADLTHLLNRLVGERVSLVLEHDPNLPNIRADKRQIEQVIMNLVVNARDAMKGNGEIKITSEVVDLQMPWQRDRAQVPPGHYVCVRVSDQGCGIAADKIQKIFEPFFTTKRVGEGTGLGLSTVYGIVKQSGGFVFVDSVVGQGTLFTLLFPSHQARAVSAIAKTPPLNTSTDVKTGTILLVEDEAPVRAFASRALRLRGYSVIEADCAERALFILEDPDVDVQLFVTDVVMPGKDGPTWVCEARGARPNIGVVFMSGYVESSLTETREKVPNSAFLPKPFSLIELTDIVASRLG